MDGVPPIGQHGFRFRIFLKQVPIMSKATVFSGFAAIIQVKGIKILLALAGLTSSLAEVSAKDERQQ